MRHARSWAENDVQKIPPPYQRAEKCEISLFFEHSTPYSRKVVKNVENDCFFVNFNIVFEKTSFLRTQAEWHKSNNQDFFHNNQGFAQNVKIHC